MKLLNKKSKFTIATLAIAVTSTALAFSLETTTAPDTFPSENPTSDYQLNDAEATKEADGLVWQRCLVGQTFKDGTCTGQATEFDSWEKALNNAVTAEQSAEGWRVPNIKELLRITENTKVFPATNTEVFLFAKSFKYSMSKGKSWKPNPSSPSSPMLWSTTPYSHNKITTLNWQPISEAESKVETDKERVKANQVYALSLDYGIPRYTYRDGKSKGEAEGQYSGDPDNVIKARYVLLVKDAGS